jgi:uncharacterized protein
MKPSIALDKNRDAVRMVIAKFPVTNPRVFGSVALKTDEDGSDLDLIVDPMPETTLFDLGGLQLDLEDLLGVHVDLLVPGDLPIKVRAQIITQAVPLHICCQHIIEFTEDFSAQEFNEDLRTQQAVAMNLLLSGEIAATLSKKFPEISITYPNIPWYNIRGMRNRIAHEYFDLDLKVIWKTITTAIPLLCDNLQNIINDSHKLII